MDVEFIDCRHAMHLKTFPNLGHHGLHVDAALLLLLEDDVWWRFIQPNKILTIVNKY